MSPQVLPPQFLRSLLCSAALGALSWGSAGLHLSLPLSPAAEAQEFEDDEFEDEIEDEFEEEFEEDFEDEFEQGFEDEFEDEFAEFEDEFEFEGASTDEHVDDEPLDDDDAFEAPDWDNEVDDNDIEEDIEAREEEFYDTAGEPDEEDGDDEVEEVGEGDFEDDDEIDDEDLFDEIEALIDEDDDDALDEFIILVPEDALDGLRDGGLIAEEIERLDSLELILAEVRAPGSFTKADIEDTVRAIVPDAAVDQNHLYSPGAPDALTDHPGLAPSSLLTPPLPGAGEGVALGVIDTAIDADHPALSGLSLEQRDFVPFDVPRPLGHGTSVASILGGQSEDYRGLLPNAQLLSASVFFETPTTGVKATTTSLVQALEWMSDSNIQVVNMSLTGPPNQVLEQAISRFIDEGLIIVAAVGNEGPTAAAVYPAAYDSVIAVTAISSEHQIYRLANRGAHVDFSAPGVDVRHAVPGGDYAVSSGTSMATPFVSAMVALDQSQAGAATPTRLDRLIHAAEDLGAPGHDEVFGHGLIRWPELTLEANAKP